MARWSITSDETERLVVGACLVHARVFGEAHEFVEAEDFSQAQLRAIWESMAALDLALVPLDSVSVWQHMQVVGTASQLRSVGGMDFLTGLMGDVVTVENIAYHAKAVTRLAERRRWDRELRELLVQAGDVGIDHDAFFGDVEARLLGMLMQRKTTSTLVGARAAMKELVVEIERRYEEKDKPQKRGVPTGFWYFDHLTGGLKPGQMVVIAARPGVGKSALAGNVVQHAASKLIPCLIFSLEMVRQEVYERMVASSGIDADKLRTGQLDVHDFVRITKATSDIAEPERIWIDDAPELTITELRSRARRWRSRAGAGDNALVVIDYLQLVKTGRKGEIPREQEVAEVSRGIKALAKEIKCPVIALAQLNRDVEKRKDKRPTLADLRESGQIEQDADIVCFLYREEEADPECAEIDKGTAELIIRKGRDLKKGLIRLAFDASITKFTNAKS